MHELAVIQSDAMGVSRWSVRDWPATARGGMLLSPRIATGSMRLRSSEAGYATDWHVSGEPVLIVVCRGVLRIELHEGAARDFEAGEAFIANDRVPSGESFDPQVHGHRAMVVGDQPLEAMHIKLAELAEADG